MSICVIISANLVHMVDQMGPAIYLGNEAKKKMKHHSNLLLRHDWNMTKGATDYTMETDVKILRILSDSRTLHYL